MQSWQGNCLKANVLYSRAGIAQQIWITNKNGAVLVDAGDGVLRDILSNDLDLDQMKGIIFTHGHFDHVGGLHSLLGFLRMTGRKETLPIFAPRGCTELFTIGDNFTKCYPDTLPFKISLQEIQAHDVVQLAGMAVEAYPVVHCGGIKDYGILGQIPALGYRISYQGETIAISGDTGICPALKKLVKGADLAILEAVYEKSENVSRESLEKEHLSEDLAQEIGKLAKEFILIHQGRKEEKK